MLRRKLKIAAIIPVVALVVWLTVRETMDRFNKQRAYPVIRELGGRIGSLTPPIPFSGSELRIEFHNTRFEAGDLERLSVLELLTSKHWVGVMFKDTNMSRDDLIELRTLLPNCHVFRIVDGERQDDR